MTNTAKNNQPTNESKSALYFLVREPSIKIANPPLIILLHGVGSNEKDLFSLAHQLPDNFLIISARAPNTLSEDRYAWFQVDFSTGKPIINKEQAEESRNIIIEYISQLKNKHAFDSTQVYLVGFSQGGVMALCAGLTRPDLIKGIAVMSGRLLPEVKPLIVSKEKLQKLKVFISHGIRDTTLPIHNARDTNSFLKSIDIIPTYKEYPEPHTISPEMVMDLLSWLN